MPLDVTVSATIARPRDEVAAYTSNPDHDTSWYVAIHEVRWLDERPARVGTRVARVARFLGKRIAYTYEIVEWEPGKRLVMRAVDSPFPMSTIYTWADDGPGRTRMSVQNVGAPDGAFKLAGPLMAWQVRRSLEGDLARLKEVLEASRPAP